MARADRPGRQWEAAVVTKVLVGLIVATVVLEALAIYLGAFRE